MAIPSIGIIGRSRAEDLDEVTVAEKRLTLKELMEMRTRIATEALSAAGLDIEQLEPNF